MHRLRRLAAALAAAAPAGWRSTRRVVGPFEVIGAVGVAVIVIGAAEIYQPAAWLVAGAVLVFVAVMGAKAWRD